MSWVTFAVVFQCGTFMECLKLFGHMPSSKLSMSLWCPSDVFIPVKVVLLSVVRFCSQMALSHWASCSCNHVPPAALHVTLCPKPSLDRRSFSGHHFATQVSLRGFNVICCLSPPLLPCSPKNNTHHHHAHPRTTHTHTPRHPKNHTHTTDKNTHPRSSSS